MGGEFDATPSKMSRNSRSCAKTTGVAVLHGEFQARNTLRARRPSETSADLGLATGQLNAFSYPFQLVAAISRPDRTQSKGLLGCPPVERCGPGSRCAEARPNGFRADGRGRR